MLLPLISRRLSPEFATLYRNLVERAFTFPGCQGRRTFIPVLPNPLNDVNTLRNPIADRAGLPAKPDWYITRAQSLFKVWQRWDRGRTDPEAPEEDLIDQELCTCPWHLPYLSLYVSAVDAQGDFYDSLCDLCGVSRRHAESKTAMLQRLENPSWGSLWRSVADWSVQPDAARAHYLVTHPITPRYVGYVLQNRLISTDELNAIRQVLGTRHPTLTNVEHAVNGVSKQVQFQGSPRLQALRADHAQLNWLVQLLEPVGGVAAPQRGHSQRRGLLRLSVELRYSQLHFVGWTVIDDEDGEGTCGERPVKWGGQSPWLRYETGARLNALTFPDPTGPIPLCGVPVAEPPVPLLAVDTQLAWHQRRVRILVPQDGCFVESYCIPHDGDVLIFKDADALLPVAHRADTTRLEACGVLYGVEVYRAHAADIDVGAPWTRAQHPGAVRTDGGIRARGGATPYLACALPRVISPVGVALEVTTNSPGVECRIRHDGRLSLGSHIDGPLTITVSTCATGPVEVGVEVPYTPFPPNQLNHAPLPETAIHSLPSAMVCSDETLGQVLHPYVRAGLLTVQVVGMTGEVSLGTVTRYLQEMGFAGHTGRGLLDLCDLGHVSDSGVNNTFLKAETPVLLHCGQGRDGRLAVWLRGALDWWKLIDQPSHDPFGISGVDLLTIGQPPSRHPAIAALGTLEDIERLADQLQAEIRVPAQRPCLPRAQPAVWQPTQLPYPLEVFNPFNPSRTLKVHEVADWKPVRALLGDTAQVLHRTSYADTHVHSQVSSHQRSARQSRWAIGRLDVAGLERFWLPSDRDTESLAVWRSTRDAWRRLEAMAPQWTPTPPSQHAGILVQESSLIIPNRLRLPSYLRRWMSELTGMLPQWLPRSDPMVASHILRWQEQPSRPAGLPIGWLPTDRWYRSYVLPTSEMAFHAARCLADAVDA